MLWVSDLTLGGVRLRRLRDRYLCPLHRGFSNAVASPEPCAGSGCSLARHTGTGAPTCKRCARTLACAEISTPSRVSAAVTASSSRAYASSAVAAAFSRALCASSTACVAFANARAPSDSPLPEPGRRSLANAPASRVRKPEGQLCGRLDVRQHRTKPACGGSTGRFCARGSRFHVGVTKDR